MKYSYEETIERYNKRLEEYGTTPEALGWNKGRDHFRFKILIDYWNLEGCSILDLGCGFGELYFYLKYILKINFNYLGVDINPALIKEAEKRFPEANFQAIDLITDHSLTDKFDYVLASGTFNGRMKNNDSFLKDIFEVMNNYSKKGFAANFLSSMADIQYEYAYYADPSFILSLGYNYSKNIILRNDYMPFEFSIYIEKSSDFDKKLAVYNKYLDFFEKK